MDVKTCDACTQRPAYEKRSIMGVELWLCEECCKLPTGHIITLNIVNSDYGRG